MIPLKFGGVCPISFSYPELATFWIAGVRCLRCPPTDTDGGVPKDDDDDDLDGPGGGCGGPGFPRLPRLGFRLDGCGDGDSSLGLLRFPPRGFGDCRGVLR